MNDSTRNRTRVLSSVEMALGFPSTDESISRPAVRSCVPTWTDPATPWEDLKHTLEAVSAGFHMPEGRLETAETVRSIIKEHNAKKAVLWEHPLIGNLGIEGLLEELGVKVLAGEIEESDYRRECAEADLGVTAADALLVDEGALLVRARRGQARSTSLLPPLHLALITAQQRLVSVLGLAPLLRNWLEQEGKLPGAFHLICGPSRTADIELDLVLGAHGAKALHIIVVDPLWTYSHSHK